MPKKKSKKRKKIIKLKTSKVKPQKKIADSKKVNIADQKVLNDLQQQKAKLNAELKLLEKAMKANSKKGDSSLVGSLSNQSSFTYT